MNPGLASVVLRLSRPGVRGGFTFSAEDPVASSPGVIFRARRLSNRPGPETDEAGRLRDFQVARFQIRLAEWLADFRDGDHLVEDLGGGRTITWQVRRWAEVNGSRGLWCEILAEEVRDGGEG